MAAMPGRHELDIHRVRYFVAVVNSGTLTAAARVLHVAQPSLSRQIRQLESELNVSLFRRESGRLYLSPAGQRFLPIATDLLTRFDRAVDVMAAPSASDPLRLTVTANATTLNDVVAPFAATLSGGPVLDLRDEPTTALYGVMLRGEADLAISAMPSAGDLAARLMARFPFFAHVAPGHRWAGRSGVTLPELLDQPLIVLDDRFATRRIFDHAVGRHSGAYKAAFEVHLPQAAQALAASGHGIAVLTDEPRYGLHAIPINDTGGPLTLPLFAAWESAHYAREGIAACVRDLTAYCLREFPYVLPGD